MIHIFTITARNYLGIALTLGESITRHHPEAKFSICVSDGLAGLDVALPNPNHCLVDVPTLFPQAVGEDLAFKYNITEYCTAVKPAIFRHLFANETDTDLVYYMDPDTYLYSRLDCITAGTPGKTLYLAPHLIDCRVADDHPYPEYRHLWEGIFNLGFCAIRRSESSARIIEWWDNRLREYCYADHLDGLHTDQKWMDYAPVFFRDELEIVANYGVNVAHWNIAERPLSFDGERFFAKQKTLVFFHFSGFDFQNELLTKHSPAQAQQAYFTPAILRLSRDYRAAVKANGFDEFIKIPYAFATFDDGTPITQPLRRLYREFNKSRTITSPFATKGDFFELVREAKLVDSSPAARSNYSKATVQNLGAKLEKVASAMRLLLRLVGFKRYAQLVKLAGYLGRFENHAFLLRKKS
jgi:hypothetical protein